MGSFILSKSYNYKSPYKKIHHIQKLLAILKQGTFERWKKSLPRGSQPKQGEREELLYCIFYTLVDGVILSSSVQNGQLFSYQEEGYVGEIGLDTNIRIFFLYLEVSRSDIQKNSRYLEKIDILGDIYIGFMHIFFVSLTLQQ